MLTQLLSPAPGPHQKPGSVASGWPHAPLGDQASFPSFSLRLHLPFSSMAEIDVLLALEFGISGRIHGASALADTYSTNVKFILVTAF